MRFFNYGQCLDGNTVCWAASPSNSSVLLTAGGLQVKIPKALITDGMRLFTTHGLKFIAGDEHLPGDAAANSNPFNEAWIRQAVATPFTYTVAGNSMVFAAGGNDTDQDLLLTLSTPTSKLSDGKSMIFSSGVFSVLLLQAGQSFEADLGNGLRTWIKDTGYRLIT
jgi:hypothetical protein